MQTISIKRIRQLDNLQNEDVQGFLRDVRLTTLFHGDNVIKIAEIAVKLDIPSEELSSYVWLQMYVETLAWSCESVPALSVVAQQFGIDFEEFQYYMEERIGVPRPDFVDDRPLVQKSFLRDPWDEEEDKLADLREDAGATGD